MPLLLEDDAPEEEQARPLPPSDTKLEPLGEASVGEIAEAVSEWLATIKDRMEGHDRFQLAVARNALGMISRGDRVDVEFADDLLAQELLGYTKQRSVDPSQPPNQHCLIRLLLLK